MKQLLLLRHAKSSWDSPELDDFRRPLADRGRSAAERLGRELLARGWLPERALVSPALRARTTWELVLAELPGAVPADFPASLYNASAESVLSEIQRAPKPVKTLLVVGHNPGLEDLARLLAGENSEAEALRRLGEKFPTGALARFAFDGAWKTLHYGAARLTHFVRPKDLR